MAISTSDGRNFNDEFEYAVQQLSPDMTVDHKGDPIGLQTQDMYDQYLETGPEAMPVKHIIDNYNINPKNWDSMLANTPLSKNIEDRRNQEVSEKDRLEADTQFNIEQLDQATMKGAPITGYNPLKITVTPRRSIEDKPMNEPFVDHEERRTVIDKLLGLTGDRYQLWPEKAARTLIDAFKLPGDVAQGKADPLSDQSIGRAAELAGAVIFGPAPVAKAAVDGTLGSIAGISAKNADKGLLEAAKVLDRRGYPNEEVYQTTGWFKGFDKQWKFELPSQNADLMPLNFKGGETKTLPEVLHFPELYEAYPAFKDIKVVKHNLGDAFAYYQHGDQPIIGLSSKLLNSKDGGEQLNILLHEVQHAIQHSEGFELARGGAKDQTKALTSAIREKVKSLESPEEAVSFLNKAIELTRQAKKQSDSLGSDIGKTLYARDPGEAEANRVISRRLWTSEEKAAESPVGTQLRYEKEGSVPSVVRFPYREK